MTEDTTLLGCAVGLLGLAVTWARSLIHRVADVEKKLAACEDKHRERDERIAALEKRRSPRKRSASRKQG